MSTIHVIRIKERNLNNTDKFIQYYCRTNELSKGVEIGCSAVVIWNCVPGIWLPITIGI